MISRAVWVAVALGGCGGDAPSPRARVLDRIPKDVASVAVASGRALAHPRVRPMIDALRSEVPAGFDCVVDAALAGEQVAVGVAPSGDVTVALATKAPVRCSALSRIDTDLWIATLGGGAPGSGLMTNDALSRARPFLRDAPIAVVTQRHGMRVLATAQPEPLAAWVAFDAADPASATALEAELRTALATKQAALAPVARAITVERTGSQVVARLDAKVQADLAVAVRAVLARTPDTARAFVCPAPFSPPVLGCHERDAERMELTVYSLASAIDEVLAARKEPVIVNGRLAGIRLRDDLAIYGLHGGDMLLSIDGRKLDAVEQVAAVLQKSRSRASFVIARAERFGTIELVEQ
jgi:hypothetical protein